MENNTDVNANEEGIPTVALIGRPNVGKSTLFNRLTRTRQALVTPVPGTTRDRREGEVLRGRYHFRLVDTGGMGFGMGLDFSREVEVQIEQALALADYVWIVLDAVEGLNPFDADLHRQVAKGGKPYAIIVNKADNPARQSDLSEFYRLGTERIHPASALHGTGLERLMEILAAEIPATVAKEKENSGEEAPRDLRVAFLGRPNVGKSSLVNRVMGEERMIVSDIAGTTREAVETPFQLNGKNYVLVDTAGIRRKSRTKEYLEKIGVLQSLGALNRVHVAVLVIDAAEKVSTQDARIASYILDHRRAVVVALNKWDRIGQKKEQKAVEEEVMRRLRFIDYASLVHTNALEGAGLTRLFLEIDKAALQFDRQIQTADLNRMVQSAVLRFPPPAKGRSQTRIYYGLQVGRRPPSFRFFTNHPAQINEGYTRFFENQMRYHFGLKGTPIHIAWQGKGEKVPGKDKGPGKGESRGRAKTQRMPESQQKMEPREGTKSKGRAKSRGMFPSAG